MYILSLIYREELSCELQCSVEDNFRTCSLSFTCSLCLFFRAVNQDMLLDLAPHEFLINEQIYRKGLGPFIRF